MPPNRALIFASVPTGWPIEGENLKVSSLPDFSLSTEPPPASSDSDGGGGITTRNHYFSYDPYQRGRLRAPDLKSYAQPYSIGEPITNAGIASVILSKNPAFAPGDVIFTPYLRFEEYGRYTGSEIKTLKIRKLLNPYHLDPKIFLGALGMTGLTAYSSLYAIGQPVKGETIFISAASGAVGQVVGQLAKREGLKVIGSVGSDEKLKFITDELDFDAGFNYKKEQPRKALERLAPAGVDIYYENVGGEMLDAALEAMNPWGRVVGCGMISQYNNSSDSDAYGVKNLFLVISKRIKIQGFIVADENMGPKYTVEHQENVAKWIHDGTFKTKISTTYGIENSVKGLIGMLKGENFGKAVLEVAPLEEEK